MINSSLKAALNVNEREALANLLADRDGSRALIKVVELLVKDQAERVLTCAHEDTLYVKLRFEGAQKVAKELESFINDYKKRLS